jgi:cytochrome c biogenesis protein ResB
VRFNNVIGGIDRGPTPNVTLYDESGRVLANGDVYPNHPLRYGSFTIHPSEYGLAVFVSLVDAAGQPLGKQTMLVDFSDTAPQGTTPAEFSLTNDAGTESLEVTMTVPLDRTASGFNRGLQRDPRVELALIPVGGSVATTRTEVALGARVPLSGGTQLQLDAIRYYARLSVVDDGSLVALFSALVVALLGLTASLLGRKFAVAAVIRSDEDGASTLVVWYRDWRGESSGARVFEEKLRSMIGTPDDEGDQ